MSYKFEVVDPADYYVVTSTYFKDDFSEMAKFILLDGDLSSTNASGGTDLKLDMLIQNVTIPMFEYNKTEGHIGDTFGVHFYGRAQLLVNFEATLIDTMDNYGKAHAVQMYRDVLRPRAVARTGIAPVLVFPGMAFQGTVIEIIFNENSETPTTIGMSIRMLVLRMLCNAPDNKEVKDLMFDYTVTPKKLDLSGSQAAAAPANTGEAQPAQLAAAEAAMNGGVPAGQADVAGLAAAEAASNASNAAAMAESDAWIKQQVAAEQAMAADNLALPTVQQTTPVVNSASSRADSMKFVSKVNKYDQQNFDNWNNMITNSGKTS